MIFPRMRKAVTTIVESIHAHPFNRQLYNGTLPRQYFKSYLQQDSLYLIDFATALTLTSKKLANQAHLQQIKKLVDDTVEFEKSLHVDYLNEHKGTQFFKVYVSKLPVIADYTQHLIHTATHAEVEVAIASLLPCFWIYSELGKTMMLTTPAEHPYGSWIASYSSKEFLESATGMIEIVTALAATSTKQDEMIAAFVKSAEYELAFWNCIYPTPEPAQQQTSTLSQKRL
jgi:thiaminase/transcriptional activator TenA